MNDHDHETGRDRQRICHRCNVGLGMFRDDAKTMRRAARYVERHRTSRRSLMQPIANVYARGSLINVSAVALRHMLSSMANAAK